MPQPIAEQLRAILESTADGLLVVDEEGKVSHSNGRFAELWRIPADVVASRDDRKLLSYVLDQLVDPEAFVSKVEQLYTSREEELDVLRFKDGRVFERFSSPLMHEDQVTGRVWSFRDVTARRQAQNALRVSEQRFRTMYNEAPVMIHSLDREGRIIEVSDHWLKTLGYSREEVVGRKATDFLTKESREHAENGTLPRFWKSGRAKDVSYQFVRSDGEVIDVLLTAIAQRGPDGEYVRSLAVSLDVTERNRAAEEKERLEEQIRHAQKLESLGILAGGIAHDFNNLLVAIMGNSDLALMSLGDNEQARVCIDDVVKASQRAADLCRQLLAYSGKGRFTVQPVDLSEVVREMGDLLEVSISKRAELRYGLAGDLPAVDADLTQLRQVMMNLITNSADAIGDSDGSIQIATGVEDCDAAALSQTYLDDELEPGRYAWVEVADDGAGMDAETLPRIFDPFYSSKHTGHGLGLAATLGIVRGHKGAIRVASEPGKGSTFRILLPVSDRTAVALAVEREAHTEWKAEGAVVLVIDDESSVLRFTRKLLERAGFEVLTAPGGREGVGLFEQNSDRVSAVLLDMTMPHMDGKATLVELQRIRQDVRVVLSSGFTEQSVIDRFAGTHLAGFVQKPYRARTLLEALRSALAPT